MEAFSLLKYWRGGAATSSAAAQGGPTTVIAAVTSPHHSSSSDESDEGPFFDLKLSVPVQTGSTGSPGSDQHEPKSDPVSPSEEPVRTGSGPEPVHNGFSRLKSASATNFRVLLLKLKKNAEKTGKQETGKSGTTTATATTNNSNSNKFFTIKFKIEETPMRSVSKRDNNSSKPRTGTNNANERRFSKDAIMQRYLKMVSKRYGGEKLSGETGETTEVAAEGRRRRDDSLVEQQDGIQSAILHCKKSFNSSRDAEMSILSRSVSDPSHDHHKSMNMSKICSEELKENGF